MTTNALSEPGQLVADAAVRAWELAGREAGLARMEWQFENRDDYWVMVGSPQEEGASAVALAVEWAEALDCFGMGVPEPAKEHGIWTWSFFAGVQVQLIVVADRDQLDAWHDEQQLRQHEEERQASSDI